MEMIPLLILVWVRGVFLKRVYPCLDKLPQKRGLKILVIRATTLHVKCPFEILVDILLWLILAHLVRLAVCSRCTSEIEQGRMPRVIYWTVRPEGFSLLLVFGPGNHISSTTYCNNAHGLAL
jgi:hypothetical protein